MPSLINPDPETGAQVQGATSLEIDLFQSGDDSRRFEQLFLGRSGKVRAQQQSLAAAF